MPRPKPHNITPPMDDRQIEAINRNFDELFKDLRVLAGRPLLSDEIADVVGGAPSRGSLIVGAVSGAEIKWTVLPLGDEARVLRSNGEDASWAQVALGTDVIGELPVENGGTERASFTEYAVIVGGITPAGALQQVSGVGTSGQVLTSNGAAALPTWEDAGGGGGPDDGYWTPITNGDPVSPELLFDSNGDCIVGFVPTP